MGTDYYIPWKLIGKYEVCFAKIENKKTYPVQYEYWFYKFYNIIQKLFYKLF